MRPVPRASLAAALILLALPGAARAVTPEWFPLPDGRGIGSGLAVDAAGDVWIAGAQASGETVPPLHELTPSAATPGTSAGIATYPTTAVAGEGCCSNQIRDVAVDRTRGVVWYTRSTGVVGRASVDGFTGATAAQASGKVDLGDIAPTADGGAWFAQNGASNTPTTGPSAWPGNRMSYAGSSLGFTDLPALSEYSGTHQDIRYDAKPSGVTIAPDGSPWFTEAQSGNPGYRIGKVASGTYAERSLPCEPGAVPCSGSYTDSGPTSIAAAPDGTLWYANEFKNRFGRLDPATDTITEFSLADLGLGGGRPFAIRSAPDGTLWLAEYGGSTAAANALVRIVPSAAPTATVFPLGSGHGPFSVAISATGDVWTSTMPFGGGAASVGRLAGAAAPGTPVVPGGTAPIGGSTPIATPKPGAVVLKPATTGTAKVQDPKVKGDSLSANQICVGPPADKCSLVYLLQSHEYVKGFPGTTAAFAAKKKKRKTRLVVVGTKSVTLSGGQQAKVTVKLNTRGRKILKRDGKLNATFVVKQRKGGKLVKVKTKKVRFKKR